MSGDKRRDIAIDALHEAATVGRHVVIDSGLASRSPSKSIRLTSARSPGARRPRSVNPKKSAVSLRWTGDASYEAVRALADEIEAAVPTRAALSIEC